MDACLISAVDRRKTFWSTQPCGSFYSCTDECAEFGLVYDRPAGVDRENPNPRSIETKNWLTGLVINILMTDGRKNETTCGYKPGRRGGHWSDSFRSDGLDSGSLIRSITVTKTVQETVNLVEAYAQKALQKLITYGVATSVKAEAKYRGNNKISLDLLIVGPSGSSEHIGLSTSRLSNQRVWNTK